MASDDEESQIARGNGLEAVWPPPPTVTPLLPPPRSSPIWLIHLPLPPFLAMLGLPKWAKSSFDFLCLLFIALLSESHGLIFGKILVGLLITPQVGALLSLLTWIFMKAVFLANHRLGKMPEQPAIAVGEILSAVDGWMGLLPNALFLVWGAFYLAGDHFHWINRLALIIWVGWFVLGCIMAAVNGARKMFTHEKAESS